MISKREMAKKIVRENGECSCSQCPFDGNECNMVHYPSGSECLGTAKAFLSQDWQPLDLEHLPEDILITPRDWQNYNDLTGCWDNVNDPLVTGILQNQLNGKYKYRYRPKPKKETVEEAAERIWKSKTFPEHFTYLPSKAYKDGFKDCAQWQKEKK
jgi:hypothetical protein